jgi:hypothetical protein
MICIASYDLTESTVIEDLAQGTVLGLGWLIVRMGCEEGVLVLLVMVRWVFFLVLVERFLNGIG